MLYIVVGVSEELKIIGVSISNKFKCEEYQ